MSVHSWLRAYALLGVPAGLALGAALSLVARDDAGWGGYASFARRAVRLGHVAAVMLPALAGLYSVLLPAGAAASDGAVWGAALWTAGGISLPAALFAVAARRRLAALLVPPATALVAASVCLAVAGLSGGAP